MAYEITDNVFKFQDWCFIMDTQNIIQILYKAKSFDEIKLEHCPSYKRFESICKEWLVENR